jgi:hypothetical protein
MGAVKSDIVFKDEDEIEAKELSCDTAREKYLLPLSAPSLTRKVGTEELPREAPLFAVWGILGP